MNVASPEFYVDGMFYRSLSFQLFTAAFPLAPLIALLTNAIDMKVDARRLLWTNRRPVAFRAEDIGEQIPLYLQTSWNYLGCNMEFISCDYRVFFYCFLLLPRLQFTVVLLELANFMLGRGVGRGLPCNGLAPNSLGVEILLVITETGLTPAWWVTGLERRTYLTYLSLSIQFLWIRSPNFIPFVCNRDVVQHFGIPERSRRGYQLIPGSIHIILRQNMGRWTVNNKHNSTCV